MRGGRGCVSDFLQKNLNLNLKKTFGEGGGGRMGRGLELLISFNKFLLGGRCGTGGRGLS